MSHHIQFSVTVTNTRELRRRATYRALAVNRMNRREWADWRRKSGIAACLAVMFEPDGDDLFGAVEIEDSRVA